MDRNECRFHSYLNPEWIWLKSFKRAIFHEITLLKLTKPNNYWFKKAEFDADAIDSCIKFAAEAKVIDMNLHLIYAGDHYIHISFRFDNFQKIILQKLHKYQIKSAMLTKIMGTRKRDQRPTPRYLSSLPWKFSRFSLQVWRVGWISDHIPGHWPLTVKLY